VRPSVHHTVFLDAVHDHGHGAFDYLLQRYPESAVQRIFELARRWGWIECDGKLSRATLTAREHSGVRLRRALEGRDTGVDIPVDKTGPEIA
jgi:hypothetical protein